LAATFFSAASVTAGALLFGGPSLFFRFFMRMSFRVRSERPRAARALGIASRSTSSPTRVSPFRTT
jgi:hypothetical protein